MYPYPPPPLPPKPPRRKHRRSIDWEFVAKVAFYVVAFGIAGIVAFHSCKGKESCDSRGGVYIKVYDGYKCIFPNQPAPPAR